MLKQIFCFFTSFEFIFFQFLIAGSTGTVFEFLPELLSPTVIFMLMSILIAFKRIIKNPFIGNSEIWGIVFYVGFSIMLVISLTYTSSSEYGMYKTMVFTTMTAWAYLGALQLNKQKSLERFFLSAVVTSVLISVHSILTYFSGEFVSGNGRIGIDGGNPIGLARVASIGALTLIVIKFYFKSTKKLFTFISLGTLIFAIVISGSRMPLLALIVCIVLLPILFSNTKISNRHVVIHRGVIKIFFVIVTLVLVMLPLVNLEPMKLFLERLDRIGEGDAATEERLMMYKSAIRLWEESPYWGNGVGSFALDYGGMDTKLYPHNIFLEILSELGMIGLFLFLGLLLIGLYKGYLILKQNKNNKYGVLILLSFIMLLINANATGDLNDNRIFFAFLGLLTVAPTLFKNRGVVSYEKG